MRLIDADKLIAQLKRYTWNMDADDAGYAMAIHDLLQDIDSQDTVQLCHNEDIDTIGDSSPYFWPDPEEGGGEDGKG